MNVYDSARKRIAFNIMVGAESFICRATVKNYKKEGKFIIQILFVNKISKMFLFE